MLWLLRRQQAVQIGSISRSSLSFRQVDCKPLFNVRKTLLSKRAGQPANPKDVSKFTEQPSDSSYNTSENVAVTAGWSGIIPSQRLREDTLIRVGWPFFLGGYIYIEIPNVSPEKSMNLQYVPETHRTLPGLNTSHKDGTQRLASSQVLSLLWVSVIDLESPVVESGWKHFGSTPIFAPRKRCRQNLRFLFGRFLFAKL